MKNCCFFLLTSTIFELRRLAQNANSIISIFYMICLVSLVTRNPFVGLPFLPLLKYGDLVTTYGEIIFKQIFNEKRLQCIVMLKSAFLLVSG